MVTGPALKLRIESMRVADIPAVHGIERASFPLPWPDYAFRQELETNRLARYLVARLDDLIVAYAGVWLMVGEAHITTFAVLPEYRRQGIGAQLLLAVLDLADEMGANVATLEVRLSNLAARRLYGRFGLKPVGLRPRYYSDNGEDALIMTSDPLASRSMRERLSRLRREVSEHGRPVGPEGKGRTSSGRPS
ncbi:hypothetical protein BH20CHL6_BH20CHL6_16610 [soil metagenome]